MVFFFGPRQRTLTWPNWRLTTLNGCSTFARMLALMRFSRSVSRTLVAGISAGLRFFTVQQRVGLDRVVDRCRWCRAPCAPGKYHCRPFWLLLHLRVAFARSTLGRTRRSDQRGVHHRAGAQPQALGAQQFVDHRQDLRCQLVLFQQPTETKK